MPKLKLWNIALFCFSLMLLASTPALAERNCTRQVSTSDGTKDITTDCSSSYTVSSDDFWNRYYFSTLVRNLEDNLHSNMQLIQDKMAAIFSLQDHAKQVGADMKVKEQERMEYQQDRQLQQEDQMESLRDRQEMQKEQQSSLQDIRSR
jgi:hypothetical protein